MKKLFLFLITLSLLFIASCTKESDDPNKKGEEEKEIIEIVLPDLTGKSRKEISEILNNYKVEYKFELDKSIVIEDDSMLDKFVRYGNNYNSGDSFKNDKKLIIYTTVLPLNAYRYKEVKMDFEWEGKSFIKDGYGEVYLSSAVDGDTAWFIDKITGDKFKLRFLGIDTPETHAGEDPWGEHAAEYTKRRLENAKTIVLESEGARTETYGRYLGFVWVDGELLNLELVELAYSNSTLSKSKYASIFTEASIEAMKTGRRFFGEIDPDYDYEHKKFK